MDNNIIKKSRVLLISGLIVTAVVLITGLSFVCRTSANASDVQANGVPVLTNTVTHGQPGLMTVENEIKTALMPVGHAMYVYGGGWNEYYDEERESAADTEANEEAKTIGVPAVWDSFYLKQDSNYTPWDVPEIDFKVHPECVHWGLDCSGYMGWVLQNLTNEKYGMNVEEFGKAQNAEGWVTYAEDIGYALTHLNYGKIIHNPNADAVDPEKDPYTDPITPAESGYELKVGNLYTYGKSDYHVWMCLGKCADGSVLLLHSSDPGVYICGTSPDYDEDNPTACTSDALDIAREYMKRYYTDFYNKFGVGGKPGDKVAGKDVGYLKYTEFNWDPAILKDPTGYRSKTPKELMKSIYCEDSADASLKFSGQAPVIHFNDALVEPSANSNSLITYNRETEADTNVNVKFEIPVGYKFDSILINDTDYSSSLDKSSNVASLNIPISATYNIECSSSELSSNPVSETAATGDYTYVFILICVMFCIFSGYRILRKD